MHRLMVAALDAFATRGYHGTATRDIAARAEMSPAALYMHFDSKDSMLAFIIRNTTERIIEQMHSAAESQPNDPENRMKAIVRSHVSFHAQWHAAGRVANNELHCLKSAQDFKDIMALRKDGEKLLSDTINEGISAGVFQVEDVKTTAFAILSMGAGVSLWYNPKGRLSPDELGDTHAQLIANMLRGDRATKRKQKAS